MQDRPTPPWPLIAVAVAPTTTAERDQLRSALERLLAADPSLRASPGAEPGQTMLEGLSEHHLDVAIGILCRIGDVDLHVGAPEVAYRETLTRRVASGPIAWPGRDGWGVGVRIILEPNAAGAGNVFEPKLIDGPVPQHCLVAVETGIQSALRAGLLAGFPVVDVKATLIGGAVQDGDTSIPALEFASRVAARAALRNGGPVLLEPIMTVAIVTPEDYVGSCIGDLRSRRAEVQGQDRRRGLSSIDALVPLANLFGYANQLRAFSRGHATVTMQYAHYEPMPPHRGGHIPPGSSAALRQAG